MEEKSSSLKEPIIKVDDDKSETSSIEKTLDYKDETLDEDVWESMVKLYYILYFNISQFYLFCLLEKRFEKNW